MSPISAMQSDGRREPSVPCPPVQPGRRALRRSHAPIPIFEERCDKGPVGQGTGGPCHDDAVMTRPFETGLRGLAPGRTKPQFTSAHGAGTALLLDHPGFGPVRTSALFPLTVHTSLMKAQKSGNLLPRSHYAGRISASPVLTLGSHESPPQLAQRHPSAHSNRSSTC